MHHPRMSHVKILVCCLFSALTKLDAARILAVFPTPSISHQIVFRPITQELASRGHDVVVITPDPAFSKGQSPANLTEIDVHDISYSTWIKEMSTIAAGSNHDMDAQFNLFLHLFLTVMKQQLFTKEVKELTMNKNIKFDLILVEACVRPALIYSHIFKAPVIQVSSFGTMVGTNSIVGAPNHPLFQPAVVRQRLYNLSLWEKIREIYRQFKFEYLSIQYAHEENVVLKQIFGPETPTVDELSNNVEMVFLNVHSFWNDNSPVPPGLIYLGGLHLRPEKELPKTCRNRQMYYYDDFEVSNLIYSDIDWNSYVSELCVLDTKIKPKKKDLLSYLESSENGVIYISFGTNIQSSILPPETVKIIMKVLSDLPYDVIWRWDTEIPDKPRNIKIFKWLPQSDLLRHPKLKLFIMQGGLQSTDEAIAAGVPLIGIPVIADQWYNVEKYGRLGIGQQLEIGAFTEEEFRRAIVTVIEDPSYRHNIQRLRSLIHDQPQRPLERAIWWIEHVLRHGGARHLRCPTANMSWTEYYEFKLVLTVLASFLSFIGLLAFSLYHTLRCIFRRNMFEVKIKTK